MQKSRTQLVPAGFLEHSSHHLQIQAKRPRQIVPIQPNFFSERLLLRLYVEEKISVRRDVARNILTCRIGGLK